MRTDPLAFELPPKLGLKIQSHRLLTAHEVRAKSNGVVSRAETFVASSGEPVVGGLFCPHIFGALERIPTERDRRRTRWGHLEFSSEIPHPTGVGAMVALPVLPPFYHPMVKLADGRYATSDLNDHYRRLISAGQTLVEVSGSASKVAVASIAETIAQLFENEWRPSFTIGPNKRTLVSLRSMLRRATDEQEVRDLFLAMGLGVEFESVT